MKTRVLVTGSEGRIGRILRRGLEADYDVYGLDVKTSPLSRHCPVDIFDLEELIRTLCLIQPTCVLHFAASVRALDDWNDNLRNNIIGTRNIYEAACQAGVKRIIYASSNQVVRGYEQSCRSDQTIPVTIEPRPINYYGCAKIFGEALARRYYETTGLESICLRIGTVSEDDLPPSDSRTGKTWLSHRDLIQIVKRSINTELGFNISFAVSANPNRLHDISSATASLGYVALDSSKNRGWKRLKRWLYRQLRRVV